MGFLWRLSPPPAMLGVAAPLALLAAVVFAASALATENSVRTLSDKTVVVERPSTPRGIDAKTGVVVDLQTGAKLWSRKTQERRLIASTTKIMTALVAISRTDPNETLVATNYRATPGESLLGLKPGEQMSAQNLIRGLLMESGNDAADTLAARTASSRAAFVAAMNRQARAIGLRNTRFSNPIGLDSPDNYSSASDLALMSKVALQVPRFSSVVDKSRATLRSSAGVRRITNRNPLVGRYRWATGVKTGHTLAAGYVLVGSAEKEDANFVSVVTGEPTEAARERDSAALLKFGRAHYTRLLPLKKKQAAAVLPVKYQDITAKVYPRSTVSLAARDGQRVIVRLTAPEEIEGPRSKGSVVGTAVVLRDGKQVAKVPVALGSAVPAAPTSAVMLHKLGSILPYLLGLLALCLIALLLLRGRGTRARRPRFVG